VATSPFRRGANSALAPAPPRPAVLWAIGLAGAVAAVLTFVFVLTGEDIDQPVVTAFLLDWITLPYILSGLVAWWARPDSRLGPLMIGAGFATFLSAFAISDLGALYTIGQVVNFLPPVLFLHVFLAFPSGRLGSAFERALVAAGYFVAFGLQLVAMLLGGYGPENLLGVVSEPGAANSLQGFQLLALSALMLAGIGLLALRRRAVRPRRPSLELLIDSFALGLLMIAVLFLSHRFEGPAIEPIRWTTFAIIGVAPFAFAVVLLEAGARRNRALLDGMPDDLFRISRDGTYLDVHAHDPVAGRPEDIVGTNLREHFSPELGEQVLASVEQALETGSVQSLEYLFEPPGHSTRHHESRILASGDDEVLMIVRDITERKQQEDEVRQARARIIEAGDTERWRLERNLHDGAQQRLVTLSLSLRMAQRRLHEDPDGAEQLLEQAASELALALEELRELARGLHPAILNERGLGPAVQALAARAPIPVDIEACPERLPQRVEVAAFYVISEALTNVAKYASATAAGVNINRDNGYLRVEVVDDGVGGADPAKGSGLRGLADRVEALAGSVAVESEPGQGTRVRAEIPC
jgi:signal transduction histidine kinase